MSTECQLLLQNIQTLRLHETTPKRILAVRIQKNGRNYFILRPDLNLFRPDSWITRLIFWAQTYFGQISTQPKAIEDLKAQIEKDAKAPEFRKYTFTDLSSPPSSTNLEEMHSALKKARSDIVNLLPEPLAYNDNLSPADNLTSSVTAVGNYLIKLLEYAERAEHLALQAIEAEPTPEEAAAVPTPPSSPSEQKRQALVEELKAFQASSPARRRNLSAVFNKEAAKPPSET